MYAPLAAQPKSASPQTATVAPPQRNSSWAVSKQPTEFLAQWREEDARRIAGRGATWAWNFSRIPVSPPDLRAGSGDARPVPAQAKLRVGAVDDPLEREADQVAGQVIRSAGPVDPLLAGPPQVSMQRAAGEGSGSRAPGIVHEVLRTPGEPLATATRALMEPRFGRDFSRVRVHADAAAGRSAGAVGADAYTVGTDVVFAVGRYRPGSTDGRHLLAHELAHVVQQGGGSAAWLQRSPTHVTLVPVDDIERDKPGSMHPDGSDLKLPTAGTYLVEVNDEDHHRTDTLSWNDVRNSPDYVDNNIVSVGADIGPFDTEIQKLLFQYTDDHIEAIPLRLIDLGSAARSSKFLRRDGVIYPLTEGGAYTYDQQNTPNIVRGTQMKLDLFYKLAERRLLIAQVVFAFSMNIAALGGAAQGMPEGKIGTGPNLGGGVAKAAGKDAIDAVADETAAAAGKEAGAVADDSATAAGKEAGAKQSAGSPQAQTPKVDAGKQGKHVPGHNNFIEGRSELTANPDELAKSAGTGDPVGKVAKGQPGFKERVDYGKEIGTYVDESSGARSPTTKAIIHYAKDGSIHIVPARP